MTCSLRPLHEVLVSAGAARGATPLGAYATRCTPVPVTNQRTEQVCLIACVQQMFAFGSTMRASIYILLLSIYVAHACCA